MYGDFSGFDVNNPISGTHLDPKRRAYLQMLEAGAPEVQGPDEESNPDIGFQPHDDTQTTDANFRPVLKRRSTAPVMNDAPEDHNWGPSDPPRDFNANLQPNEALDNDMLDAQDDETMEKLMREGMEGTPSSDRVRQLEDSIQQQTHPKMSMKHRLLNMGLTVAPTVAGALIDGTYGASGAAEGTLDYEQQQYKRNQDTLTNTRSQLEAERQRQERQWEKRAQLPITMANMRMNREFRRRTLAQGDAKVVTGQENANTAAGRVTNQGRQIDLGYYGKGIDPKTNLPIELDKLPAGQRAKIQLDMATESLREAQAELAKAKASNIPWERSLAERKLQQAQESHNMAGAVFARDTYGRDLEGNIIPGTPLDDDGNAVGWKANTWLKPSGQSRSRADQGKAVIEGGNQLIDTITKHKGKIGDMNAILNNAFLGTPIADVESAGVAAELASFAALQPALHGFRGQGALEEFIKIIGGLPKNPEALISAIKGIQKTALVVEHVGTQRTAPANPAAGQPSRGPAPAAGGVIKMVRDKTTGKLRQAKAGE